MAIVHDLIARSQLQHLKKQTPYTEVAVIDSGTIAALSFGF